MPASTSRTPWSTFSGVSRLMRPSSSSSPQSPQVEPAGRCFHRFAMVPPPASCSGWYRCVPTRYLLTLRCAYRPDGLRLVAHDEARFRRLRRRAPPRADRPVPHPPAEAPARPRGVGGGLRDRAARRGRRPRSSGGCTRRASRAGRSRATARPAGACPRATPSIILEDMDLDGVDVQVMHPNLSLFGLYSDDHELSMAHARVYNDYVVERFSPYFERIAPTAPIPLTDVDDAVAEIERVAAGGFRAILLPAVAAAAVLLARLRPGVGGRAGQRRARVHPHPDRWREGQRPERPRRSRSSWSRPRRSTSR